MKAETGNVEYHVSTLDTREILKENIIWEPFCLSSLRRLSSSAGMTSV